MSLENAFYEVCDQAKEPEGAYVSLYSRGQVYGGPEEGGWWRTIAKATSMSRKRTMLRSSRPVRSDPGAFSQCQNGKTD